MSDNDLRRRNIQLEEKWDAEHAIRQRRQVGSPGPAASQSPERRRTSPQNRSATANPRNAKRRKRRRKVNWKGWAILIGIGLLVLLLIIGLVSLIVSWVSTDEPETTVTTTEEITEPEETTESPSKIADALILEADKLALCYDYDGAIAVLESFGENWREMPQLAEAEAGYLAAKDALVLWTKPEQIPHISFQVLIADPERAFDGDNLADRYSQNRVTTSEFSAILQALYDNNYVLVSMHDVVTPVTDERGNVTYETGKIYLPAGKKPIILSQEDVHYYDFMIDGDDDGIPDIKGDGFASRLVLDDADFVTCEYVRIDGQTVTGDYDLIPILEHFIQEHPDFSYQGARAVIGVTGHEGVFGRMTHPDCEATLGQDAYLTEIRQTQEIANRLRQRGYEIACCSYGDVSYLQLSASSVADDVQKWETEVQPVVGDTDIFLYPAGSEIGTTASYSGEKYQTLYSAGYRYFSNVDAVEYWTQYKNDYARIARRVIDGYRMWWWQEDLDDLFDSHAVLDPKRPTPVPSIV